MARHFECAHFADCYYRDHPEARRWVPFSKTVKLLAVAHNDAVLNRQDEALASQFASVGIEEEGEEEQEDTLDFSHLKDESAVQATDQADQATDQITGGKTPLPAGSFPQLKNPVLSRSLIEKTESSANSHLGSLSGPSEEAA